MKYLCLLLLAGCASDSYMIKESELLPYKESAQITKLNQESKSLRIASIEDQRVQKSIGFAYTGVEYKKTPVYLQKGLINTLKSQLSNSFEMRNIEVVPNGELNLLVVVKELNISEFIEKHQPERAKCKVAFEFSIDQNKTKWSGSYITSFISAGDMSDGTERLAPTLASCINELVEKLMSDEKFTNILRKN
jgi:uncharacterized lipoprotein YajG